MDRDAYRVLQVDPEAHHQVIEAAYRALARLYHPDNSDSLASARRMAELNDAYAKVRTADRRALYDTQRKRQAAATTVVVGPIGAATMRAGRATAGKSEGEAILSFGRYEGWTIEQIAQHDPDYLRWLARHSSGIRYRSRIDAILAALPPSTPRRRS